MKNIFYFKSHIFSYVRSYKIAIYTKLMLNKTEIVIRPDYLFYCIVLLPKGHTLFSWISTWFKKKHTIINKTSIIIYVKYL